MRTQQTFYVKGQKVNILWLAGHIQSTVYFSFFKIKSFTNLKHILSLWAVQKQDVGWILDITIVYPLL